MKPVPHSLEADVLLKSGSRDFILPKTLLISRRDSLSVSSFSSSSSESAAPRLSTEAFARTAPGTVGEGLGDGVAAVGAAPAILFIRPDDLSSRCSAFFSASFSFEMRSAEILDPCFISPALGGREAEVVVVVVVVVNSSTTSFLIDLEGLVCVVDVALVGVVDSSSCLKCIEALVGAGIGAVGFSSGLVRIEANAGAGVAVEALVCAGVVGSSSSLDRVEGLDGVVDSSSSLLLSELLFGLARNGVSSCGVASRCVPLRRVVQRGVSSCGVVSC